MIDPMRAGMQEAYVSNVINIFCKWTCCLQSNQVKGTPQDYIYELINGKFFEPTSYFKNAIMNDYWNTEPTSSSKSMADGLNVKKSHLNKILILEMTREFNISIINSLLHS